jgi:hypothetical protein
LCQCSMARLLQFVSSRLFKLIASGCKTAVTTLMDEGITHISD